MDKQKIDEILKRVADANGVSVEEVRREIETALAMSALSHGEKPQAPENAIAHLSKLAKEKMK